MSKLICREGRTKQSFKSECDINNIVKKYTKNGTLPSMIKENPVYGDFSKPIDYMTAHDIIEKADKQFNALSSEIRKRFNNRPEEFLEFVENPENTDELIKMGLANPKKVEVPAAGPQ